MCEAAYCQLSFFMLRAGSVSVRGYDQGRHLHGLPGTALPPHLPISLPAPHRAPLHPTMKWTALLILLLLGLSALAPAR